MSDAPRDNNHIPTMLLESSTNPGTVLPAKGDEATGRLLVDNSGGGSGTVTSVSVVSANGLAGTVATETTTPAITLSTTITGILQGNGTAISAITVGSGLSFAAGTLSATGGGTVDTVVGTADRITVDSTDPANPVVNIAATYVGQNTITTLGTITTGTWNGTDVAVTAGGTGLSAISALSIWVANSANTITEVTPGAGNSIRINGAGNAWEAFTPSSAVPTTITVADEATDTTCFLAFFTAATGDLGPKTNTNITFNSNTGVATFASTVLTTTDINGGTIDGATIGANSATTIVGTTITANTGFLPDIDGGAYLGQGTQAFSGLFLDTTATINIDNGNWVATHSSAILTVGTGDLRVTTAGTNTASVVTVGGTQTLTAKTLTSPAINTSITTPDATFTAFAGATTLLTIGGTGASASLFAPSTLDTSSSVTGAIRTSGGISAAKAGWIGTNLNIGTAGTATGELRLSGATSGTVTVKTNATAGTWTLELPANDGDSGQFLSTNGSGVTSWASAGGTTVVSLIPKPDFNSFAAGSLVSDTNTVAKLGRVVIPFSMTVTKLSVDHNTHTADGTYDIVLYTEDGQTKVIDITTANLTGTGVVTTAVSNVAVSPGVYYILIVPNSTAAGEFRCYTPSISVNLGSLVTGEPQACGTLTVTASTPPATFDPTAITATTTSALQFRLD